MEKMSDEIQLDDLYKIMKLIGFVSPNRTKGDIEKWLYVNDPRKAGDSSNPATASKLKSLMDKLSPWCVPERILEVFDAGYSAGIKDAKEGNLCGMRYNEALSILAGKYGG